MNNSIKSAVLVSAVLSAAAVLPVQVQAAPADDTTVVLVHGAFADGSSWNKVIPLLQAKGLKVVAVQNPLSSLADDVVVGAIGPVTSVALRNAGFRCDFQASEPSVEEIVATLAVHFEKISAQSASGANS